jgi:hypothetical protein
MSTNNNEANGEVSVTEPTQLQILKKKISDFLKQTGLAFEYKVENDFIKFIYRFNNSKVFIVKIQKKANGLVANYHIHLFRNEHFVTQSYDVSESEYVDNSTFDEFKLLINYIILNENGE